MAFDKNCLRCVLEGGSQGGGVPHFKEQYCLFISVCQTAALSGGTFGSVNKRIWSPEKDYAEILSFYDCLSYIFLQTNEQHLQRISYHGRCLNFCLRINIYEIGYYIRLYEQDDFACRVRTWNDSYMWRVCTLSPIGKWLFKCNFLLGFRT